MSKRATRHAKPDGEMGHVRNVRAVALAAMVGVGIGIFYWVMLSGLRPPGGARYALVPVVAIGVWGAFSQPVVLRNRQSVLAVSLSNIPALAAIVFLPAGWALAALSAGYLAAGAQRRMSPAKVMNNWLWNAGAFAVGYYFYNRALGQALPTSSKGWWVAALTVVVIDGVNLVLLLGGVALIDVRWRTPPLRAIAYQAGVSALLCTAGGLVAISVVSVNAWGILLVTAFAVAADLAYHGTVHSRQRYTNLERLYEFTRRLGSLTEGREVMSTVVEEARSLLSAGRAELVIPLGTPGDSAMRCWVTGDDAPEMEGPSSFNLLDVQATVRGAFLADQVTGSPDEPLGKALAERGFIDALSAPLQRDDPAGGYLLVANRGTKNERFKQSDLRFLEALAANAGVSLRSSRLLEQLRREAAERQQQAQHDALTGLPNRLLFTERLEQALVSAGPGERLAVMIIDLDGFKEINDTLGHHTGDGILREVAARLGPLGQGADVVARLGGDEFAFLLSRAPSDRSIADLATRLLDLISEPLAVEDLLLDVRASLGVAVAPHNSQDATGLLRQADIAMYAAKSSGGGSCRFYDKAEDHSTLRRLRLATELRRAISQADLDIWYQPVVRIGTGEVVGCEALLRWNHDQFGPISPVEFIPVAESAGLIDPLTFWVAEKALAQAKQWRRIVPGLSMSVNLSARTLLSLDIPHRLARLVDEVGIEPSALTLELTESSTLADPACSQRILQGLQDLGVNLSIDDYGTGFSSLSRLKHLPFDELKIDRSFVKEMIHDKGDEAIVRSTIELARYLGRTVTAEGVEDQATLQALEALGCDLAQGFFLARPLPAAQCEAWLLAASSALGNTLRVPRLSDRGNRQARHRLPRKEAGPGQAL